MAAIVAGLYAAFFYEEKSAIFLKFRNMDASNEFDASENAVWLLHQTRKFAAETHLAGNETDFRKIVQKCEGTEILLENSKSVQCTFQLVLFHEDTGQIIEMIPAKFNDKRRVLCLLGRNLDLNFIPTKVITHIINYFKKNNFGFLCFYCKRRFNGKGSKHRCKKRRSCFACHRPLLQPDTFVNPTTKELFCPDEIEPKEKNICKKCNLSTRSTTCEKLHKKLVCRWGWYCLKCEHYTFRSKFFPKTEDIILQHNCLYWPCTFCGEQILKSLKQKHLCPLQTLGYTEVIPRLGFIQMSFCGSGAAYCLDCKANDFCTFCSDNSSAEKPNIATLFLEQEIGYFDSYTFSDINSSTQIKKNALVQKYIPSFFEVVQTKRPKVLFNQKQSVKLRKNLFTEGKGVVEKLLDFLLTHNLTNLTLLINCSESNELIHFIAVLVQYGLTPKILQSNNRILMVECPEICLKMLDSQNYVTKTFERAADNLNVTFHYFPKKWNKPAFYNFEGNCPPVEDFWNFEDSASTVGKKDLFIRHIGKSWNLWQNLQKHTYQKTFLTATTILTFIFDCFDLQLLLAKQSEMITHKKFVHPVRKPLITYSGFIYQLFLLFTKSKIKMLRPPIEYQSSKGEIEFSQYLEHTFPNHEFQNAWSPEGQDKTFLPISIPDIVDKSTNTLYFYNGCEIHSHNPEVCLFKRKVRGQDIEKNKKFGEKIKQLQETSRGNIKEIKILWQCIWQYQKRSNDSVKQFMRNIYTNPPTYRLHVHDAGKLKLNI